MDQDRTTDNALAADAAQGDEIAFAELYRRYEPVSRRSANRARRTHPQLDVDAVTNLALTRLWQGLQSYDGEGDFEHWAAVVIANAVRTAARSLRSQKSQHDWGALLAFESTDGDWDSPVDRVADDAPDPLHTVLSDEEELTLRQRLERVLSAREATVLRLRISGWTYREIGEELDVDDKAVDNAIRRGSQKLRASGVV